MLYLLNAYLCQLSFKGEYEHQAILLWLVLHTVLHVSFAGIIF